MNKIKVASKIVRIGGQIVFWTTLVSAIALSVLILAVRNIPEGVHFSFDRQIVPLGELDHTAQISILIVIIAVMAVVLRGIWHGTELFRLYEHGKIFFAENIMRIKRIGETLILLAIVKLFGSITVTAVLMAEEIDTPLGITINLTALIVGLLIYVISWVMDEGRALREEQELTI